MKQFWKNRFETLLDFVYDIVTVIYYIIVVILAVFIMAKVFLWLS